MGRKPGPKGSRRSPRASVGITWGLADAIDELVREPRFGFTDRNDFANRACAKLIQDCRDALLKDMVRKAASEGRPGAMEEAWRIAFGGAAQENAGSRPSPAR